MTDLVSNLSLRLFCEHYASKKHAYCFVLLFIFWREMILEKALFTNPAKEKVSSL